MRKLRSINIKYQKCFGNVLNQLIARERHLENWKFTKNSLEYWSEKDFQFHHWIKTKEKSLFGACSWKVIQMDVKWNIYMIRCIRRILIFLQIQGMEYLPHHFRWEIRTGSAYLSYESAFVSNRICNFKEFELKNRKHIEILHQQFSHLKGFRLVKFLKILWGSQIRLIKNFQ